ncbi:TolC family protein [Ramlibacter sp. AW1]|uniref:TolC family protein n=1 Tax=Ramlibacter aurantiacus TaxID=2801330 RepID=A0A936ZRY4_9BURK|nr:TolC family protein [Ramlibacter aurantiacus]MBL0422551.1 TolC family protein [Ramlibacter aurantiacus]
MFFFFRGLGAAALALMVAAHAGAQQLTLPEAQQIALSRSQSLAAHDAAAEATREMAVTAAQLPDPVLRAGVDNVPLSGPERFSLSRDFMTMRRIGVMQELTRSDKRKLRAERVLREGARIQAERLMSVADIQRETALAWIERGYTDQTLDLLRAQLDEAQLQVQGAEVAFRAGRGNQADVFTARAAIVDLQDTVRRAERLRQNANVSLARWIGPEAAARAAATPVLDWRDAVVEQVLSAQRWRGQPRLRLLDAQVQAAEIEVRQAQANTRADWSVELMYSQRGSRYSDMVSVGVSIPLQLDRANRQNREIAAKQALLRQAEAAYEEALRAEEAVARQWLNEWTNGRLRVERLTIDLLPQTRNRTEAALATYRAGRGSLEAVLGARRDELDARMQILSLEAEASRVWAQLRYLAPDPTLASR